MTEIPAFSRSATSSRSARPSCFACTDCGMSSRGKLQRRIVIGPVNIPFTKTLRQPTKDLTGLLGETNSVFRFLDCHGLRTRDISNNNGRSDVTRSKRLDPSILSKNESLQTFAEILNLTSISLRKVDTMSFLSGSPWTKTSNPTSSWNLIIA